MFPDNYNPVLNPFCFFFGGGGVKYVVNLYFDCFFIQYKPCCQSKDFSVPSSSSQFVPSQMQGKVSESGEESRLGCYCVCVRVKGVKLISSVYISVTLGAQRELSLFSSRWNWDSPNPTPAGECDSPPFGSGGRGTLACRGEGGSNSDAGTYTVVLYVYMYFAIGSLHKPATPSSCLLFSLFLFLNQRLYSKRNMVHGTLCRS
jgi:hypothetical protein